MKNGLRKFNFSYCRARRKISGNLTLHIGDQRSIAMEQSTTERAPQPTKRWFGSNSNGRRAQAAAAFVALTVVLALAASVGAALYDGLHVPSGKQACLRKAAGDAHTLFEAFFQNPPDTNALAQIGQACRG